SWFSTERLTEPSEPRTDACLDGAERLLQPGRRFRIRQLGEEGGLNRHSLGRRQDRKGLAQMSTLVLAGHRVVRGPRGRRWHGAVRVTGTPLLPLVAPQPVN